MKKKPMRSSDTFRLYPNHKNLYQQSCQNQRKYKLSILIFQYPHYIHSLSSDQDSQPLYHPNKTIFIHLKLHDRKVPQCYLSLILFFFIIIKMNQSDRQPINKEVPINQEVKILVKSKLEKFLSIDTPNVHTQKQDLFKRKESTDKSRRGQNKSKKPIWQTWGTQQYQNDNKIGIFSQRQVFGNHLQGEQWIIQQKKRQKQFVFQPGQMKTIPEKSAKSIQFIYIQPSNSQQKLELLRKIGYKFQDQQFIPNDQSLNGKHGPDPEWEVIKWKKIRYIIPNSQIFLKKVHPNDIKQGYLGDCYFLAGLSALAQRPDRIFNLFLLKQKNQLNYYSLKMLFRGKWRTIDLDDSLPFVFSTPAFGRCTQGGLWVNLLQKAWAKMYGSYKQIQGGFPSQPLHDLTGAPIKQMFLSHKSSKTNDEWKYLMEASIKQYAMVASSNTDSDSKVSPAGIMQRHAYTFLNATQLKTSQGLQRIVQLRNTWGRCQYKGKWADDDPLWSTISQEQKQRIQYKNDKQDGVFFMNYDDFTNEFEILTIAEINDNASYVYESSYDPQKKGVYFSLKILQQGNYSLQVDKTPQRSLPIQKQRSYRYPISFLQIGKINATSSQMLQDYRDARKVMCKNYKLVPGNYVVYVKIEFNPAYQEDYEVNLAVYSSFTCGISIATKQDVFKLTGKKSIQWDGQKKRKPIKNKQTKPSNFSEQQITKKIIKHYAISSQKDTQTNIIQNDQHHHSQSYHKSYRDLSDVERKNPLFMFGFQNFILQKINIKNQQPKNKIDKKQVETQIHKNNVDKQKNKQISSSKNQKNKQLFKKQKQIHNNQTTQTSTSKKIQKQKEKEKIKVQKEQLTNKDTIQNKILVQVKPDIYKKEDKNKDENKRKQQVKNHTSNSQTTSNNYVNNNMHLPLNQSIGVINPKIKQNELQNKTLNQNQKQKETLNQKDIQKQKQIQKNKQVLKFQKTKKQSKETQRPSFVDGNNEFKNSHKKIPHQINKNKPIKVQPKKQQIVTPQKIEIKQSKQVITTSNSTSTVFTHKKMQQNLSTNQTVRQNRILQPSVNQQDVQKKQIKQNLRKRRKVRDILKYSQNIQQNDVILYDLMPKLIL